MQQANTSRRLMLNSHCQVCEFRQRCHGEALAKDDLSLLRGMTGCHGITTTRNTP
jgi:predicted RecB family nuclease